jgi:predicted GNAT family N-acyltransferase
MSEFRIVDADWATHQPALREVRSSVFVREQKVPEELEWDAVDPDCLHLLAMGPDGQPIGTARLQPDGKLGRMAVLPPWRGRGVGQALLTRALGLARERGFSRVFLHAQVSAEGFYRHYGFMPHGPLFEEAGIPHQAMALSLREETQDGGRP